MYEEDGKSDCEFTSPLSGDDSDKKVWWWIHPLSLCVRKRQRRFDSLFPHPFLKWTRRAAAAGLYAAHNTCVHTGGHARRTGGHAEDGGCTEVMEVIREVKVSRVSLSP